MIGVLDYGAGNLRSVLNVLSEVGAEFEIVNTAGGLRAASRIILPGVGHFGHMMRSIDRMNVRGALLECMGAGVPLLGICLGLQAMFAASDEAAGVHGLRLFDGIVRRFDDRARVPHMGWNEVDIRPSSRLFANVGLRPFVYFAHSYYAPVLDSTTATCTYTVPYTAALESGNVFAVQFHPEKSGAVGLQVVKNFVEL